MTATSRRTVLAALATAAVSGSVTAGQARAVVAVEDHYASSTDLYTRLAGREGTDFARRYRRHERVDSSLGSVFPYGRTVVMAPHGGGIETGTSELCLAIAGYHPATLAPLPGGGALHDYWMFEGLLDAGNGDLHITSSHIDDRVALSLAAGSLNVVSLHGCRPDQAGAPVSRPEAVVVGGRNATFKQYLHDELRAAGFQTIDGSAVPDLAGVDPENLCNRTLLGKGGQLELTTDLRRSMFGTFTRAGRAGSTNEIFDAFTAAVRTAVTRLEAGADQVIL
ncbi:poly-gamma-glutamate hydrolase family protein [Streptomyces sp. NBC_01317]|uniref:poly-gamma-glutamate hydrolase family protein n=1 Tax=Streptomyces sp. NBC_01317 TaxID=2903822 RepID=UPI002E15CF57|nr:poly-gamma-glutamate hydrolase family protein [Streptomyces sp. NBC_01317]